MAKDAKGHGSEKRSGPDAPAVGQHIQQAARNALKFGADDPRVGQSLRNAAAVAAHQTGVGQVGTPLPPDLAKIRRQYDRNESINSHSENAALLAKHFGTPEEHARGKQLVAERNRIGHLPDGGREYQNEMNRKYSHHLGFH